MKHLKLKHLVLIIFSAWNMQNINAQESKHKFFDGIRLRQSFQNSNETPDPAVISYTKPRNEKGSYYIDAGLGYAFSQQARGDWFVFVEHHRNSMVNDESNSLQFGVGNEWFTNKHFLTNDDNKNRYTANIISNAKYSKDFINKIQSLQASFEITPVIAPRLNSNALLPNTFVQWGKEFAIEYFPSAGIEWETRLQRDIDSTKGSIGRAMFKLNVNAYPFFTSLKNRIELYFDGTLRQDVINTTDYSKGFYPSLKTGVNLLFTKKPLISIGGSYNNIQNPGLGIPKQEFFMVALKIKI